MDDLNFGHVLGAYGYVQVVDYSTRRLLYRLSRDSNSIPWTPSKLNGSACTFMRRRGDDVARIKSRRNLCDAQDKECEKKHRNDRF